ncbi:DUF3298 and DUF4163 domain-containing protein [Caproiciproducens sp. R1]|uniref:DUF3298 and DUF4163 domain-containing protein n=1 Tax=Caproiciproducens sp. R1 TaxID=3435000 RepID=UPI004033A508
MYEPNFSAELTAQKVEREFQYENTAVITMTAEFPEIRLRGNRAAESRINGMIRMQTENFYRYVAGTLYRQAVQEYRDSQTNGFPFRPYDAILKYETAYNENCFLSLYRDQYEYTGGAHGNTVRRSDTWSLQNGRRYPLARFFGPHSNYRYRLLQNILKQADRNMAENPGVYFDDYRKLIAQYFNEEQYYLTPQGVAIYYQQYEIAPYSTGIVVFTVPYDVLGWKPSCMLR